MLVVKNILRGVCPRCGKGAIFRTSMLRGWLSVHERCPVCGLKFEREQGYFLGAMYVSYALSIPPMLLLVLAFWKLTGWPYDVAILAAFLAYLPFVPYVTRLARAVWIHLDRAVDPNN